MKIYLSPSNQQDNIYNDGRNECDVCFETARLLYEMLAGVGVEVYLPNKTDTLSQRIVQSNKLKCDYHIPIHTNAGGGNGTRIFVYPPNVNNKMAKSILKHVGEWSVGKTDKVVTNTTFREIKETSAIAIYIEGEFHDTNGNHIKPEEYSASIFLGICEALGITAKPTNAKTDEIPNVDDGGKFYRVQIGAYKDRKNAERACREIRDKGLKAYIDYH